MDEECEWDDWYSIQQYRCLERDTASHGIDPVKAGTFWAIQDPRTLSIFLNRPLKPGPRQRPTSTDAIPMQCDLCGWTPPFDRQGQTKDWVREPIGTHQSPLHEHIAT